jgi:hypothetical protein
MGSPSPTKISMSVIKSKLLQPALTSHYLCYFGLPREDENGGIRKFLTQRKTPYNDSELISLSCSEASLPGASLATVDIDNDYHGVSEKHVYRRLYDDRADFTFYVDRNYNIIKLFENWIAYCAGENNFREQKNGNYSYRVNYPNLYRTDTLYITKFERDVQTGGVNSSSTIEYQFINAYPLSINSMPVSYDASNLLKCTVSFTYSRYIIEPKTFSNATLQTSGNPELNSAIERALNPLSGPGFSDSSFDRRALDALANDSGYVSSNVQ